MKPSLAEQIQSAKSAYERAKREHPRSALSTKLYFRLRDLVTKQLRKENRAA